MSQPSAEQAREAAREILAEPRFGSDQDGSALEDALQTILSPLRDLADWIGGISLGDEIDIGIQVPLWIPLLAGLILALVAGARGMRRRAAADAAGTVERGPDGGPGPEELERRAEQAERTGDNSLAVQLRFRAGLLRLAAAGALDLRSSTTARDVAGRLPSAEMDWLVTSFETTAYGGLPATAADASGSRERWRAVRSAEGRAGR